MRATLMTVLLSVLVAVPGAWAGPLLEGEDREKAERLAARAIEFLRESQEERTGGWSTNPRGPDLPGVSALALTGMLMDPEINERDETVRRGLEYLLSFRQDDGGIYDTLLPSYNTGLALSVLAQVEDPDARAAIEPAQRFLMGLQYSEDAVTEGEAGRTTRRVDEDHPFYGGVGYGRHGRPDNSNLTIVLQGLWDSGIDSEEAVFDRAVKFLERTQMHEDINDMPYAEGSRQGGFIYSTSTDEENIGRGQSFAGMIEEEQPDGGRVSRLRAYGSMTYAGFKSYLYANLDRDDHRVRAALDWMTRHYTLDENPGLGPDGQYYFYISFARAMAAWGEPELEVVKPDSEEKESRRWAADLIEKLAELQEEDGSFRPVHDRWMEADPVLITSYSLIAIQEALGRTIRPVRAHVGPN